MDCTLTGDTIRTLRLERSLTQRQLAQSLAVTEQAVSKWERGLGCPDVSLLPRLAKELGAPIERLLEQPSPPPQLSGGFMRNLNFFVCPRCGSLITAVGSPVISCCGRTLEPCVPQKPDEFHRLTLEEVEDEWYITSDHPMEKGHYISFLALVKGDQFTVLQRWPEWELQARLPRRGHGFLYWYCTRDGLFRQRI